MNTFEKDNILDEGDILVECADCGHLSIVPRNCIEDDLVCDCCQSDNLYEIFEITQKNLDGFPLLACPVCGLLKIATEQNAYDECELCDGEDFIVLGINPSSKRRNQKQRLSSMSDHRLSLDHYELYSYTRPLYPSDPSHPIDKNFLHYEPTPSGAYFLYKNFDKTYKIVEKDNRGEVVHIDDNLPKRKAEKLFGKYIRDRHYEIWANYRRESRSRETILSAKNPMKDISNMGKLRGAVLTGYSDIMTDEYFNNSQNAKNIESEIMDRLEGKGINEGDVGFDDAYKAEYKKLWDEIKEEIGEDNNRKIENELKKYARDFEWGFLKRGGGWIPEENIDGKEPPKEPSFVVYYNENGLKTWNDFLRRMDYLGRKYGQKEVNIFDRVDSHEKERTQNDDKTHRSIGKGYAYGLTTTEHNGYDLDKDENVFKKRGYLSLYGDKARKLESKERDKPFTDVGKPGKRRFIDDPNKEFKMMFDRSKELQGKSNTTSKLSSARRHLRNDMY
jgi:hypothetical protein